MQQISLLADWPEKGAFGPAISNHEIIPMAQLALNALAFTRGIPLFEGLNLTLERGARLGLVAANGRGKTSLLHILLGDEEPSAGQITRARGLRTALMPQMLPAALAGLNPHAAVLAALDSDAAENESWRADIALDDVQMPADLRSLPLHELSGGWQRMVLLAHATVSEPDLLLLDEPTNHLDLTRIGALQDYLAALPRATAVIIASHDRAFLDATTNQTLFLRPQRSQDFALAYSPACAALELADEAEGRRFDNEMRKAKDLRKQAAKLKNVGINSGSDLLLTKTKQLQERAAKLEEQARPAHLERSAGTIKLSNSGTHAKALVSFDRAEIATPDGRILFKLGPLWIERGDRVVVLGPNGAGKTQLVNAVLRAIHASADDAPGKIRAAASLVLGHSDQELGQLSGFKTAMEAITHNFAIGDQRVRGLLASAGMNIEMQTMPIAKLSGGQRARLAMLQLRLAYPNFYLLDEPTNHLDIEGQETLETELLEQGATCLLVSHDRTFIRNVATRIWVIEGRRLVEVDDPEPVFETLMANHDG